MPFGDLLYVESHLYEIFTRDETIPIIKPFTENASFADSADPYSSLRLFASQSMAVSHIRVPEVILRLFSFGSLSLI